MSLCEICERPMAKATAHQARPMIVCATCEKTSATTTREAEDRYYRALREMFEGAARVWAENTMRREA